MSVIHTWASMKYQLFEKLSGEQWPISNKFFSKVQNKKIHTRISFNVSLNKKKKYTERIVREYVALLFLVKQTD